MHLFIKLCQILIFKKGDGDRLKSRGCILASKEGIVVGHWEQVLLCPQLPDLFGRRIVILHVIYKKLMV